MSTLHAGHLRDDMRIVRTSLAGSTVTAADATTDENHYLSHNMRAFPSPAVSARASRKHATVHKNFSQLPGFGEPPNGPEFFTTTSGTSFLSKGVTPVSTPRFSATARQPTDIFGVRALPTPREPYVSTATAMGETAAGTSRRPQPRFVNGGGFRNASVVPLDRSLMSEGGPPPSFQR